MPLVFVPPALRRRQQNPAENCVATTGTGFDLGYAEPAYNGQIAIARGGLIPTPTVVPEHTTTNVVVPGSAAHTVRITAVPTHTFSWRIELPPPPRDTYIVSGQICKAWKSPVVPLQTIITTCRNIQTVMANRGQAALCNMALPAPGDAQFGQLVLVPWPDARSFDNHICWHEVQHVADHRWLAEQIFGPVDQWAQTAMAAGTAFTCDDQATLVRATGVPVTYARNALRIYQYWQRCIQQSGDLYHGTPAGDFPLLEQHGYNRTQDRQPVLQAVFKVRAVAPIVAPVTPGSPTHLPFQIEQGLLDRNEAALAHGASVARVVNAPNLPPPGGGGLLVIPAPAAEVFVEFSGLWGDDDDL